MPMALPPYSANQSRFCSSTRPRAWNSRTIDGELAGLGVELADIRGGKVEQIEIVVVIGRDAVRRDGAVVARILERAEVLPLAGDGIEPQDLRAVGVLDPDLAVDVGVGGREKCLLGGVGLPLLRHLPGLECP